MDMVNNFITDPRFRNWIKETEYDNNIMRLITDVSIGHSHNRLHLNANISQWNGPRFGSWSNIFLFVFQLMLSFLDKSQPTYVLHHGYSLARLFIQEFRPALFRGRSEICRILVFSLLTGFNSKISAIRQNSAATLYFMMKMNFNLTKRNFARSQLQIMGAIFRTEIAILM